MKFTAGCKTQPYIFLVLLWFFNTPSACDGEASLSMFAHKAGKTER